MEQGFPSFYIETKDGDINDESIFDFGFYIFKNNTEEIPIGGIKCDKFIDKYIEDPYTKS